MRKMHKASGSKKMRLSRRFFCICILLLSLLANFFPAVKGQAEGELKLNTDILIDKGTDIGSNGDFPIKALLFSKEIEVQNKKLQQKNLEIIAAKQEIVFNKQSINHFNKGSITKKLFQNYSPQIIDNTDNHHSEKESNLYFIGTIGGFLLMLLGILFGNRWAKHRQRSRKIV